MQHSETGESSDGRVEIARDAVLVSCIQCRRLHPPEYPLEFHPVCPACAERHRRYVRSARAAERRRRGALPASIPPCPMPRPVPEA